MKVDQKLLEQIIFEVIGRFKAKTQLLLVHDGKQTREKLEYIVSELQDHWQVRLFDCNHDTEPEVSSRCTNEQHYAFLDVDQDLIVRGALGLTDTPASSMLASALREGCPVVMQPVKELQWLLSAREQVIMTERGKRYRTHLLYHKDTLVQFGAWFGTIAAWRPTELRLDRRLLTEQDIQKMDASEIREIRVTASTIITHLARDAARKKGIQIRVDEESS